MQHPIDPNTYDYSDPFGSMAGRSYAHTGSDYIVAYGEVYSVADAIVYHTGWNEGNGNYICCYLPGHDWDGVEGGAYIAYLHLSSINVTEQQSVKQGQKIGVSGNTGSNSRGPHLHVTLSNSDLAYLGLGAKVDPFAYIQARLGSPVPPKPVEPPKPTPVPPTPAGPPTPVKLTPAQQRQAIAKQRQYLKNARMNLANERRLGPRKDERKMAKYREQIARAKTRIKNIRRNGY